MSSSRSKSLSSHISISCSGSSVTLVPMPVDGQRLVNTEPITHPDDLVPGGLYILLTNPKPPEHMYREAAEAELSESNHSKRRQRKRGRGRGRERRSGKFHDSSDEDDKRNDDLSPSDSREKLYLGREIRHDSNSSLDSEGTTTATVSSIATADSCDSSDNTSSSSSSSNGSTFTVSTRSSTSEHECKLEHEARFKDHHLNVDLTRTEILPIHSPQSIYIKDHSNSLLKKHLATSQYSTSIPLSPSQPSEFFIEKTESDIDIEQDAGIAAMLASVASIPQRYFKYNAVLAKKIEIALRLVDKLQLQLRGPDYSDSISDDDDQGMQGSDRVLEQQRRRRRSVDQKERHSKWERDERDHSISRLRRLSVNNRVDHNKHKILNKKTKSNRDSVSRSRTPLPLPDSSRHHRYNNQYSKGSSLHSSPSHYHATTATKKSSSSTLLTPGERREIKSKILHLLHAVWRTAWAPYSPKMRYFHVTDTSTPQHMLRAEQSLNQASLWRRVLDTNHDALADVPGQSTGGRGQGKWTTARDGSGFYGASGLAKTTGVPGSMSYLIEPTHLFRRSPYHAPHVYVFGKHTEKTTSERELEQAALLRQTRNLFMDEIIKNKSHSDEDLERLLNDVIAQLRGLEDDEDALSFHNWRYVRDRLRREFWISRTMELNP